MKSMSLRFGIIHLALGKAVKTVEGRLIGAMAIRYPNRRLGFGIHSNDNFCESDSNMDSES